MSQNKKLKIAIGADHAGFEYKEILREFLSEHEIKDFGTYSPDSVDYPDFAHPVASAVENHEFDFGILVCGSANGVAITANKLASLARRHNNANIICIPERFVSADLAKQMTTTFLTTEFEGGRHEGRVNKISC
jgi:ribose 5-phosphate isomerase B